VQDLKQKRFKKYLRKDTISGDKSYNVNFKYTCLYHQVTARNID